MSQTLHWPNESGWYWVQSQLIDSICYAIDHDGKVKIAIALIDTVKDYRDIWPTEFGADVRFARIAEQSPWAKQQ